MFPTHPSGSYAGVAGQPMAARSPASLPMPGSNAARYPSPDPGVEHRRRGRLAGRDAALLARAVRDPLKRRRVQGIERGDPLGRDDLDEHVVRRRRHGRVLRGERLRADLLDVDEIRLVCPGDGVDRVVHRALHHRHATSLPVGRRPDEDRLGLGRGVPVADHVCPRHGRRSETTTKVAQASSPRAM